jgi:hypothetical protein
MVDRSENHRNSSHLDPKNKEKIRIPFGSQVDIPLNDAGDEGHWICISPPGTPRNLRDDDADDDDGIGAVTTARPAVEAESCELAGLFEGI